MIWSAEKFFFSFVGFRELVFVDSHELECGKMPSKRVMNWFFEKSHDFHLIASLGLMILTGFVRVW